MTSPVRVSERRYRSIEETALDAIVRMEARTADRELCVRSDGTKFPVGPSE